MGIQRYVTSSGAVRYRARIKFHGREIATRVFERRRDAEAWEREQKRRLHLGEWFDPRRGRVRLETVAEDWLASRSAVKRRTRETDEATWRRAGLDAFVKAEGRFRNDVIIQRGSEEFDRARRETRHGDARERLSNELGGACQAYAAGKDTAAAR